MYVSAASAELRDLERYHIVAIGGVISYGLFRQFVLGDIGSFEAPTEWLDQLAAEQGGAVGVLSLFVVLRAFSSGGRH